MHGGARMCQKLSDLFNTVPHDRNGNRIVGLYGMPGQGKTTLCKTFCNLNLQKFDGNVCYLDFGRGIHFDRLKHARRCLYNLGDRNERELLVLNNVTVESGREDEEVYYYLRGRINSWFLLVARSEDILTKNFKIEKQSCMRIPRLEEEEAISILLESVFPAESKSGAQDRGFALKCAKRCLLKEACSDHAVEDPTFHPLALITFGRHLFRKYDADLSQWAAEADRLEIGSGGGSGDVFIVVDKAFDLMDPKLRILFVLLSLHMEPNMSLHQVASWLEITFKKEFEYEYIEKAAKDLWMMGFIEEIEPEIRIHDFYLEFAQSKPRWLLSKCNRFTSEVSAALFSNDETGVELVNLEDCQNLRAINVVIHRRWSIDDLLKISSSYYGKNNVRFPLGMEVEGSLHIGKVSDFQVLNLSIVNVLQILYVNIEYWGEPIDLGDLTGCVSLREIYVSTSEYACGLSKFPRINGLPHLEKASFESCRDVVGPLDCSNCVKLQRLVFNNCTDMANIPLIDGCTNLSKIVLNKCYRLYSRKELLDDAEIRELYISSSEDASIPECCGGVKNQLLWNVVTLREIPYLGRISNLTVLKLYGCDVTEPPYVTCCSMLEEVYFFALKNMWSFPSFSSLKKLKILCLCNCENVKAPPDIGGCDGLEVYHLLYNSGNYSESLLRQIDGCPLLREFRLSWRNRAGDLEWHKQDEILPHWNDLVPKKFVEWQWLQDKEKQVKKCWRRGKGYYCITASYASGGGSGTLGKVPNAVSL